MRNNLNIRDGFPTMGAALFLREIQLMLVVRAMAQSNGNHSEAARLLKYKRCTFVEMRKKFGLEKDFVQAEAEQKYGKLEIHVLERFE